jgi:hypothetical protein
MRRLHCGIKVLGTAAAALCIFASATTASAMALTERQWPIGKLTFRDTEQIKCGPARKLFLKAHWYDVASWVENSTWERKHKQHDWDPGFQTGFSIAKSGNYYWKTCVRWGRVTNRYPDRRGFTFDNYIGVGAFIQPATRKPPTLPQNWRFDVWEPTSDPAPFYTNSKSGEGDYLVSSQLQHGFGPGGAVIERRSVPSPRR